MRRPLFTVLFAFILGEVSYLTINSRALTGCLTALFVVLFFSFVRGFPIHNKSTALLLAVFFALGLFRAYLTGCFPGEKGEPDFKAVRQAEAYTVFVNHNNPGSFDYETYLRTRSVSELLSAPFASVREYCAGRLQAVADQETASVLSGILLGDKSNIDRDLKTLYRMTGIAHILAISGLHVQLLGGLFLWLFHRIRLPQGLSRLLAVCICACYALLSGAGFSSLRAVLMFALSMLGLSLGRSYDMLTAAAVAFSLFSLVNPFVIFDPGLILSFSAILGISLGQIFVRRLLQKRKYRVMKRHHPRRFQLLSSFWIAFFLQISMLPAIAASYFEIPVFAMLINLPVVTLMTPLFICGGLVLCFSFFYVPLSQVFLFPVRGILFLYEKISSFVLSLPFSVFNTGHLTLPMLLLFYATGIVLWWLMSERGMETAALLRKRIQEKIGRPGTTWRLWKIGRPGTTGKSPSGWFMIVILIGCFAGMFVLGMEERREMIVCLDCGQGEGVLLRTADGTVICIDGGSLQKRNLGENVLAPALKYFGMARVDYWIVSHTDRDHISGLKELLEYGALSGISVDNLVISAYAPFDAEMRELLFLAEARGVNVVRLKEGDRISGKKATVTAVHPNADYCAFSDENSETGEGGWQGEFERESAEGSGTGEGGWQGGKSMVDKNDASLAVYYESARFTALFTGDMGSEAVASMLTSLQFSEIKRPISVLKIPHHGSKNSLAPELYRLLDADGVALISCGKNNSYGHPAPVVLEELEACGCRYIRTDEVGAILLE